ncbi:MAG: radical SAM protein [Magnetococcus sp. DMHC-1]
MLPLRLDYSDVTFVAMIEFTTKCNLRCVYCNKSSDAEKFQKGIDLPEEYILATIQLLRMRGLSQIYPNRIGETTMRKGWEHICRKTLDTGIAHIIVTNLARLLTDDEVEVLARFATIQVSVDTADQKLFSKIRRGANLPTVLENMERIQNSARQIGVRGPEFWFSMVVSDKTVHGLEETVRLGIRNGVTGFYFSGMYKQKDITGAFNVYHVKTLPKPELESALQSLESAIDLVRKSGCKADKIPVAGYSSFRMMMTSCHYMISKFPMMF